MNDYKNRVLISPAHYVLAGDSRSEFSISAIMINKIAEADRKTQFFVICGRCFDKELVSQPNVHVCEIFINQTELTLSFLNRILFYIGIFTKSFKVIRENKIDVIWHHLPSGRYSFNPLIFFGIDKLYNKNILRVIGGLQYNENTTNGIVPENAVITGDVTYSKKYSKYFILFHKFLKLIFGLFSNYYFSLFDKYIFDTEFGRTEYIKLHPKSIFDSNSIVIPLGINSKVFSYNEKNYSAPLHFLYAGNLIPRKRIHIGLSVCAELKKRDVKFVFHIVGDGEEKENLKETASLLNIEDEVIFHGVIKNSEMKNFYKEAHFLFLFSQSESFGLVLLEAWASGLLFIGSNLNSFKERISTKENGLLFDIDKTSISEIADSLQHLTKEDYLRMIRKAKEDLKLFDWEHKTTQYLKSLTSR